MTEGVPCTLQMTRYLAGVPKKPSHKGSSALLAAVNKVDFHQ